MSGIAQSAESAAPTYAAPARPDADSSDAQNPSAHQRRRSGSGSGASSPADDKVASATEQRKDSDPPLPEEGELNETELNDDGWEYLLDGNCGAYYFYNRYTGQTQWDNPRVPGAPTAYASTIAPGTNTSGAPGTSSPPKSKYGGYNPAIHGNYDPKADYAVEARKQEEAEEEEAAAATNSAGSYGATAHFNRFTGRFQNSSITPENYNDDNKSKRQMGAFFDVDLAANSHNGKSLKAERRNKPPTKKEVKAFRAKKHAKQKEKRLAWLRD